MWLSDRESCGSSIRTNVTIRYLPIKYRHHLLQHQRPSLSKGCSADRASDKMVADKRLLQHILHHNCRQGLQRFIHCDQGPSSFPASSRTVAAVVTDYHLRYSPHQNRITLSILKCVSEINCEVINRFSSSFWVQLHDLIRSPANMASDVFRPFCQLPWLTKKRGISFFYVPPLFDSIVDYLKALYIVKCRILIWHLAIKNDICHLTKCQSYFTL